MATATGKAMLLIAYSEEIVDGEPINISSNCLPIKALNREPAGHSFHAAALRSVGHSTESNTDDTIENEVPKEKENVYVQSSSDPHSSKGKKKPGGETKQQDHYALLGLSHLRYLATEDQIRKSYRECALKHHPDKQASLLLAELTEAAKEAKKDEIETHFKAIQHSYEVLMDPVRRRVYDSTDEFDDEVPCDCTPQDFFKVFGPVFLRNGRWSIGQPIPTLGDDKTPINEVDTFYDFWYNFKSWREFSHEDEHDVEQAEDREHKRWMERQNAKLSEKARKEEYTRIRILVDNAYKRDPRILRRKDELKAEKKKKKEAKHLAKKLLEEEAARVAEEEKRRKEEEEKRAAEAASNQKKMREKEKKLLRKERTRLRTLSIPILSENLLYLTDDNVESLCSSLDREQLKNLCDQMEGKEVIESAEILKTMYEKLKDDDKKDGKNMMQNGSVAVKGNAAYISIEKKEKPWNKEEIELLRKGMLKYPKGTSRRWEVISEFLGTKRSVEEILKATKTVLLQKPDSAKAFDSFLEKRKPSQAIASPLSTRDDIKTVPSITKQTLVSDSFPEKLSTLPNGGNSSNAAEKKIANHVELQESSIQSEKSKTSPPEKTKVSDNIVSENGMSPISDVDIWSEVQEKALVQALKTFPKDTNRRWERVSAAVPGRNVIQCKKKFATLKENFRNKKGGV